MGQKFSKPVINHVRAVYGDSPIIILLDIVIYFIKMLYVFEYFCNDMAINICHSFQSIKYSYTRWFSYDSISFNYFTIMQLLMESWLKILFFKKSIKLMIFKQAYYNHQLLLVLYIIIILFLVYTSDIYRKSLILTFF